MLLPVLWLSWVCARGGGLGGRTTRRALRCPPAPGPAQAWHLFTLLLGSGPRARATVVSDLSLGSGFSV